MIFEKVFEGSVGECLGEVSLAGNEGAGRGTVRDDMLDRDTVVLLR